MEETDRAFSIGHERGCVEKDFEFEDPWEPATSPDFLREQIEAELTEPHPLFGKDLLPIAIRADCDDVLVKTSGGVALVHLTWCRRSRPSPDFPHTLFLNNWEDFLEQVYRPDLAAWLEENPPDEWDLLIKEVGEQR